MKWLIVGSQGQLGSDLMELLGDDAVGLDLPDIDITSQASVDEVLERVQPDAVVNAAAYTAVDAAEGDEATALAVNGAGPEHLARACAARPGTVLVQVSTDYVFDGSGTGPYDEDAAPGPVSAYGRTKLAGERAVLEVLPERSYVVRTAWLYGLHGANNFVKTMLRLEATRDTVSVVDDQRGQPTWSHDLAQQIIALVRAGAAPGIYHGTNSGAVTWFGFTQEIFRLAGADPARVEPTTSAAFQRPAPRPANSVLGHRRWGEAGIPEMRPWQEALAEAMPGLREH
jgi:dTDP-4-dehydrorhamnose reductase